jgi:hypothetical protein
MFQVPISEWTANLAMGVHGNRQQNFSWEIQYSFCPSYLRQPSTYQKQYIPELKNIKSFCAGYINAVNYDKIITILFLFSVNVNSPNAKLKHNIKFKV